NTASSGTYNYSQFAHDDIALGDASLMQVHVVDAHMRFINFTRDLDGEVLWRQEAQQIITGAPTEVCYRFAGKLIGYVGNNGTLDTKENGSIANRAATQRLGRC